MEKTKKCKDCGRELPLDDFYYMRVGRYNPRCKECERKRQRQRKNVVPTCKAPDNLPGSACIRAECFGTLHKKIEAAIIKS